MIENHDRFPLPLRALQIFEVAARHENFTAAGRALGLTQSAVSRKVTELEAVLDVRLFRRSGPNLTLTETGRALAERVSYALGDLQRACAETRSSRDNGIVTLSMLPSVAAKWLAPRLERFTAAQPEIDLRISASRNLVDFTREMIDGAIRYGPGGWRNLETTWLGSESVQPVCAPSLRTKHGIAGPSDLLRVPLLHADIAEDWAAWFSAAGLANAEVPRGPKLGDDTAILQAVLLGQGVALGRSLLVADDLAAGRLVAPFDVRLEASYSYWFVCPKGAGEGPVGESLAVVRDWIVQEFAQQPDTTHPS